MNTVLLNTINLDDGRIIKKGSGGGGGVTIKNQSKSVDIVENGTTEIVADSGYTGLGKVSVNVNVVSDNDIAETDAEVCRVFFNAGLCANENYITKDEAARITDSDMVSFSQNRSIRTFNGFKYFTSITKLPGNMFTNGTLLSIELPEGLTSIGDACFMSNPLASIKIPSGVTSIGNLAFMNCGQLNSIELPAGLTNIGGQAFTGCRSLNKITSLATTAPNADETSFGIPISTSSFVGRNTYNTGENMLYVPAGATGYDTGAWLDPLQNPDACGFTIKYQGEINNQDKVVDIVENGSTEVVADAGFTGLSKVVVNTNVASSGGSDMPIIGDGKTYLYIKIAAKGRMTVPLYFSQTVDNGVTIDWGDGSATKTLSGTGNKNTTHTYADVGEYTISLNPSSGCTLGLGRNSTSYCVMGGLGNNGIVYCNMLQAVEIGKNVISIGDSAFKSCHSLASIVIPEGVTSIGQEAFYHCYSLASVVIPNSVTSIGNYSFNACYSLASVVIPNSVTRIGIFSFNACYSLASVVIPNSVTSIGASTFNACYSLASVVIPNSVTSIGGSAFYDCYSLASIVIPEGVTSIVYSAFDDCRSLASIVIPEGVTSIDNYSFNNCYGMTFYDFSQHTSVPILGGTMAFSNSPSDCKIVVPDALYDEWIAATNWSNSSIASKIIKVSEFNA